MDEVRENALRGLAVMCTADGRVCDVLSDTTQLSRPPLVGEPLSRILVAEHHAKLRAFFEQLARGDAIFDWTMNVDTPGGVELLDFVGSATPDGYLVMAAATQDDVAEFVEQFMAMNSELIGLVRDLRKRDAASGRVLSEYTELNDALIETQRELSRRNAELESSRRFLESILGATPDLVYIYDLAEHRCTYANDGLQRLLGFTEEQAKELLADPDTLLFDEMTRRIMAEWRESVASATDDEVLEREFLTRNSVGEQRCMDSREKVLARDPEGRPVQILGVASDVTAKRELENELKRQASTDDLTGASNRRRFLSVGIEELARARRYERPVSLMLLDLDRLKHINDQWGHAAGDKALLRLVAACRDSLRGTDLLARFGGDEFAVLLPETDLAGAKEVAERIAHNLGSRQIDVSGEAVAVTTSIGVSTFRGPEDTLDTLVGRADEALYRAKAAGSHRVETERPATA